MHTETINVTGMSCGGCVSKVTQALQAVPGVSHVQVALPGTARVEFDEKLISGEHLEAAVKMRVTGLRSATLQLPNRLKAAAECVDDVQIGGLLLPSDSKPGQPNGFFSD
ncbi:MAG: copper chaperone [Pseudomonas sp.]|jgi:copper chaperone